MTTIFIEQQPDGDFRVKLQSPDPIIFKLAIDTLKSFIPVPLRRYDPRIKQWTVVEAAEERLNRWLAYCCQTLHAEVKWVDADEAGQSKKTWTPPPPPRQHQTSADAFKALHLLPSAPPEVVKAAYRALAQKHHPDHQGDVMEMQKLNIAFEILSKQVAA